MDVGVESDVKYSLKEFAISTGFDMCVPFTSIYLGAVEIDLDGATRFSTFHNFLHYFCHLHHHKYQVMTMELNVDRIKNVLEKKSLGLYR